MPISQIILARGSGGGGGGGGGGGTYLPWTVEWFHKSNPSQISSFPRVFGVATYPVQSIGFSLEGIYYGWAGGNAIGTGVSVTHDSWQHWAMVSDGSVLSIYKDGVRVVTGNRTSRVANSDASFYVGIDSSASNGYKGLLTNFRVVKNQAMYDPTQTTITVPTSPLISNANTELLLKAMDSNSLTTDSSSRNRNPNYGGIAFNADTPFTAASPVTISGHPWNDVGTPAIYVHKTDFPGGANIQAGWLFVANNYTATVTSATNPPGEYYVMTLSITSGVMDDSSGTFTQPALGGSIETYTTQYGFMLYNAGIEWALDVPNP
jgi:hypothetical protein